MLLIPILARWGVPERFRKALATLMAIVAVVAILGLVGTLWLRSHDKEVIEDHEAGIATQVTKATEAANAAASEAAGDTRTQVEKSNADAQKAADGSHDPLRAGLDSLRKGTASPRAPAR